MKQIIFILALLLLASCSSNSATPQPVGFAGNYKGSFTVSSETISMKLSVTLSDSANDIYSGLLTSLKNGNELTVTCSSLEAGEFSCYRFTGSQSFLMEGKHNGTKWTGTVADGINSGTFSLSK
jgi:ABC-type oligopeptide transport system substrate-binding subunit